MTIKLTDKQSISLFHNKELKLRIKRKGIVYYIENYENGYYITDWTGKQYKNIKVIDMFEDNQKRRSVTN